MNIKSLTSLLLLSLLTLGCAKTVTKKPSDTEIMVNRLLDIKEERFILSDSEGEPSYNELKAYKEWESIYIKYSKYNEADKSLSRDELKKLLWMAYIVKETSNASLSEAFSSDLTPVFQQNKAEFIKIMSELTFLIPSSCYYLNKYFGFEGKNAEKKEAFMRNNKPAFLEGLGSEKAGQCLQYFLKSP